MYPNPSASLRTLHRISSVMAIGALAALPRVTPLVALPRELLTLVLSQPSIGARELGRLECVEHALRMVLADHNEGMWRCLFLREHREPVLKPRGFWIKS